MNRRQALSLLAGGAAWASLPGSVLAVGPRSRLRLARLVTRGGAPLVRAGALRQLAWELDKRTAIVTAEQATRVKLDARELFRQPLLFLVGDRAFDPWPAAEMARLRRFLQYGGFLLVDSAESQPGGPFDVSVRALVKGLFPRQPMARLESSHTLHKSFYLLDKFIGRTTTRPYLEGVDHDGRTVVVYSQNDLTGAWARDNFGQWEHPIYPGGQEQRERALRWGINIVMYALCLDYKADQVHVPFILKRRRWRVRR